MLLHLQNKKKSNAVTDDAHGSCKLSSRHNIVTWNTDNFDEQLYDIDWIVLISSDSSWKRRQIFLWNCLLLPKMINHFLYSAPSLNSLINCPHKKHGQLSWVRVPTRDHVYKYILSITDTAPLQLAAEPTSPCNFFAMRPKKKLVSWLF